MRMRDRSSDIKGRSNLPTTRYQGSKQASVPIFRNLLAPGGRWRSPWISPTLAIGERDDPLRAGYPPRSQTLWKHMGFRGSSGSSVLKCLRCARRRLLAELAGAVSRTGVLSVSGQGNLPGIKLEAKRGVSQQLCYQLHDGRVIFTAPQGLDGLATSCAAPRHAHPYMLLVLRSTKTDVAWPASHARV
jgi:hypothetical protein